MLGPIDDILKGLPVNAVLRDRILQMDAEIKRLGQENAALQEEKADLLAANNELMNKLAKIEKSANGFVPTHGLKVRKIPTGGYDESVAYCFHCESPLHADHQTKPLVCSSCGYKSSVRAKDLSIIIGMLNGVPAPSWFRG